MKRIEKVGTKGTLVESNTYRHVKSFTVEQESKTIIKKQTYLEIKYGLPL